MPLKYCELRIEWGLSVPKIISEHCELVKLYHINCSGPVFLRHSVYSTRWCAMVGRSRSWRALFIATVQQASQTSQSVSKQLAGPTRFDLDRTPRHRTFVKSSPGSHTTDTQYTDVTSRGCGVMLSVCVDMWLRRVSYIATSDERARDDTRW